MSFVNLITKSHYIYTHAERQVKAGNLGEKYRLIIFTVVPCIFDILKSLHLPN